MIKIAGIALCVLICCLVLKRYNPVFAAALSVVGAVILFLAVAGELGNVFSSVSRLASSVPSSAAYIKIMLKVLGITLIAQFVSDVCRDNGENALASITETASKIIVVTIILPLFETVIKIVTGLVK